MDFALLLLCVLLIATWGLIYWLLRFYKRRRILFFVNLSAFVGLQTFLMISASKDPDPGGGFIYLLLILSGLHTTLLLIYSFVLYLDTK